MEEIFTLTLLLGLTVLFVQKTKEVLGIKILTTHSYSIDDLIIKPEK